MANENASSATRKAEQARSAGGQLDTAYEHWDRWWADSDRRHEWSQPDETITALISSLPVGAATRILDLGTGVGRHALALARKGFAVVATDASQTGLDQLAARAKEEGVTIELHRAPFVAVPLSDASIDHVVAWNVVYHGDRDVVAAALAECRRVLRPTGLLHLTLLSKRHHAYGVGEEVRPDTYVDEHSDSDKAHPHYYVDGGGATSLLEEAGFAMTSIEEVEQPQTGSCHWRIVAEVRHTPASPL